LAVIAEEKRDGNWVLIEETNPGEWAIGGKPIGLPDNVTSTRRVAYVPAR
jgi:phenylpyruvate tautomerase PptA (4-oxalocrotonate tautomerase family)